MKYIKYLIIVLIVIIITIVILLLSINSKSNNAYNIGNLNNNSLTYNVVAENEQENNMEEPNLEILHTDIIEEGKDLKLGYVNNQTYYFTIRSLYDTYIDKIGNKNKTFLKNTLSPQYIKDYNITDDNIFTYLTVPELENSMQYYKSNITEMLTTQINEQTEVYIVKGNCRIEGTNTIFSVQVMFAVDTVNQLYYTYPYKYIQNKGIDKLTKGDILKNYLKEDFIANENNQYKCINKTDAQVAEEYLEHFKELINYYPNTAYSQLNTEYRTARFGSKDKFNQYLKDNATVLALMHIKEYKVDSYNTYTDYTCVDQYGNIYIFRQQDGIMHYTAFLDNYTIPSAETVEEYKEENNSSKAIYQVNTFIKKVNTKDYEAIYNHLDSTFKNNHFNTLESFKTYIKENFYDCNKLTITDNKEINNYYSFQCTITNYKNENETKEITIIMSVGENMDYTMSFSF